MSAKPVISTVLLDLDGTLADTAPDLASALNTLLASEGMDPLPYDGIRAHVSRGSTALVHLGFGETLDEARFSTLRERFLTLYQNALCVETRLFPGMEEVLSHIESSGFDWGIVTNKPAWLTDPLVEALGLDGRAACVVSGDTTQQRKPHPAPLLHASDLAGAAPAACVYVGDDPRDIEAGNAAGMTTLVARYGYIHESLDPTQWGADGIIDDIREIRAWLPAPSAAGSGGG